MTRAPKKEKPFATEVDLCARFLSALPEGWTPYAETAGWDILLVRDRDQLQIGIEAKLKFNLQVICQALEEHGGGWWATLEGPDCRAVLIPEGEPGIGRVADYIGLTVIRVRTPQASLYGVPVFSPDLPGGNSCNDGRWHEWAPAKRCQLPDYVPDVRAGDSAPVQLTDWKIKALKIAATLELRGYVTRHDFNVHRLDHRRWMAPNSWLVRDGDRYVAGSMPNFKGQHPKVYAEILAEADQWLPAPPPPPAQAAML
jgi:hypothetical protein